jgi:hypothetical protein
MHDGSGLKKPEEKARKNKENVWLVIEKKTKGKNDEI